MGQDIGKVRMAAWVTPDAKAGWDRFCVEHGVTLSGLVETIGVWIGELASLEEMSDQSRAVAARAREVDRARRARSDSSG